MLCFVVYPSLCPASLYSLVELESKTLVTPRMSSDSNSSDGGSGRDHAVDISPMETLAEVVLDRSFEAVMAVHNNRELAMALATPVDLDKKAVEHNTEQKKRATSHAEVLAKLQGEDSKRSYVDPRIVIARKNMRGADGAVPPRSRMRSAKHYPVCETVGFGDDKGRATCDYELHCVHPCRAAAWGTST